MYESIFWAIVAILVATTIGLFVFYGAPIFQLYISAMFSRVHVSFFELMFMRIRDRHLDPGLIVHPLISAHKAGLKYITLDDLEAHHLSGGNVERIVHALISASKANIELDFKTATAIDLAGRNVLEAVQTSVNPKTIPTLPIAAVAQDGIQLIVKALVTVRTNIKQLIGGANEETIIARVGEGIVQSIGMAKDHKRIIEHPDEISKLVLSKGLDTGTAFEILSINIADVDVGKNIGAELMKEQAEADKQKAQAEAEKRKLSAMVLEQEMKAEAERAKAHMLQAEAEIPIAIADAFRNGKMGIMEYYQYKNLKADTDMRESISKSTRFENEDETII